MNPPPCDGDFLDRIPVTREDFARQNPGLPAPPLPGVSPYDLPGVRNHDQPALPPTQDQIQRELLRRQQQSRMLCLYYYSNAVRLKLDSENEEVHSLDRIKEFPDLDPVWLDMLRDHVGEMRGKSLGKNCRVLSTFMKALLVALWAF